MRVKTTASRFWHALGRSPEYAPNLRCSKRALAIALVAALLLALFCEVRVLPQNADTSAQEMAAMHLMLQAEQEIKAMRHELGIPLDPILDPNQTGLIGFTYSDITTTEGALVAKRTSLNPAFAGLVVRLLQEAGVKAGDKVAVNLTGSFPALNIATLAACRALQLNPQIISSVGASTYGANIPNLTWLDMEQRLYTKKIVPFHSIAVSFGGVIENGGGIDGTGLILAQEAVSRHGAPLLDEGNYTFVERDLLRRKALFEKEGKVSAFINVGGALTSLGWVADAAKLDNGLLKSLPRNKERGRGLVFRYFEEGVPVIHLLNVVRLAERYALPVDPIPLPLEIASAQRFLARFLWLAAFLVMWGLTCLFLLWREDEKKFLRTLFLP